MATEQDSEVLARFHENLAQTHLLPAEHFMDAAYVSGELIYSSLQDYGIELVCPARPDTSWQSKAKHGFSITDFFIDWEAKQVICPQG